MTFTKQDVIRAMKHAVELKGSDYVYEPPEDVSDCVYSDEEGNPSCIVGYVLKELAPDVFEDVRRNEWPEDEDEDGDYGPSAVSVDGLGLEYNGFEWRAVQALARAQVVQDSAIVRGLNSVPLEKATWGNALEAAKKKV